MGGRVHWGRASSAPSGQACPQPFKATSHSALGPQLCAKASSRWFVRAFVQFSGILWASGLKLAIIEPFTPWKLANATNQGLFFPFPGEPAVKHSPAHHCLEPTSVFISLTIFWVISIWSWEGELSVIYLSLNYQPGVLKRVWPSTCRDSELPISEFYFSLKWPEDWER